VGKEKTSKLVPPYVNFQHMIIGCLELCISQCSHFAVTHKPWVWKMVGSVHDLFHGASMYAWIYQVGYLLVYTVLNS